MAAMLGSCEYKIESRSQCYVIANPHKSMFYVPSRPRPLVGARESENKCTVPGPTCVGKSFNKIKLDLEKNRLGERITN